MSWLLSTFMGIVVLAVSNADHPLWINEIEELPDIDRIISRSSDEAYRLPKNVIPLEYDIYIDLYFDERIDRPFSYDGEETIIIQAVEENVTTIVTHANVENIYNVTLTTENGDIVPLNSLEPITLEPQYHFLKVNLEQQLQVGRNYSLNIAYTKEMNEGPLKRGIWKGWYTDADGVERIYATTHFQPYNARQAFPCWDEPLFKAVFKLHLSRPVGYSGIFSNTKIERSENIGNDRVRDHFTETPKMSSYLVTFLVSETFRVIAQNTSFNPPVRIIGRSNTIGLGNHVLELSVGMTSFFDEYFQIPYSTLHPNLMNDHVSSPDWASAGTENWGMVSYRELHMIIDPQETIMSVEHYTTTLISHELAHTWFGNLVTCFWWSNTWINEAFASYFGYVAAHEVFPKYDLHEHFNSRYIQGSLSFDSGASTVPLNHEVNTPAQVTGHFGTISYSKGAAFLKMLTNIITPKTFQKACQYFLLNNFYKATDQYDLLEAFERAIGEDKTLSEYQNFNFSDFYRIWVNEPGYPLLSVNLNHRTGKIELTQERFFINPSVAPTDQIYPIPITYLSKLNPSPSLKPIYMMTTKNATLENDSKDEWIIVNYKQHGHYRVTYDENTWNSISNALLDSRRSIDYLNRAQIVDDVFALMRSEKMTYDFGFKILRFLRYEDNYHVWRPAISGYSFLRNRLRFLPEAQATFDSFILSYMENVINTIGFEPRPQESVTESLLRQEVLHFACTLRHDGCVFDSSQKFFYMMMDQRYRLDPRIRRHVYETGVQRGGSMEFSYLLNRFKSSNIANDQLEMLRGLASTQSPELLGSYLDLTLDKIVRSHDKVNAFNYALLGNKENAYRVLQFVKNNIDAIRKAYTEDSPPRPVHTVLSNLAAYLDEAGLVEYEEWLKSTQSSTAQYSTAISAISSARNNMAWGEKNADIILKAAKDGATALIVSSLLLITTSLLVITA